MFAEILHAASASTYDFRLTANPDDPLRHLFDDWVAYYRVKWAVSKVLRPHSILEIGVRFGYSGLAFLAASPAASYTGIDNDSKTFGGTQSAATWARRAVSGYHAEILIADSQRMGAFPGGRYDLIHIDGQQDQPGLQHDLELALSQGEYILVDGFFWTRDNFFSASEFLLRYRDLIEYYGVIPGYAGELLIRPKPVIPGNLPHKPESSSQIQSAYTREYYLSDCGGAEAFKKSHGAILEDSRLRAVAALAEQAPAGRALDLGCGRGELAIALANQGRDVTAVDYSGDAISLAQDAAARNGLGPEQIRFIRSDVNTLFLTGSYQAIVASDLIEHMLPAELDALYVRVVEHLAPTGLFVVHTYPNLWFYRYEHARRVRAAHAVNAYLPADPRSRYERLMHINEQSPRTLLRQLRRNFPFVLLWFAAPGLERPFDNLTRRFSHSEMRSASDLFALASHSPVDAQSVAAHLLMGPLTVAEASGVHIRIAQAPHSVRSGGSFTVAVSITNHSHSVLKSEAPNPVRISYHWLDPAGRVVHYEGERTLLSPAVPPQAQHLYQARVRAPRAAGALVLRITLVQEFVQWFDDPRIGRYDDTSIEVD